ncbi:hypothetical protein T492DRAFT_834062 [Pavlovales sp. CCMP2436]|nr:hypothetical protein T492DRAFT_834062 [Pavlovales sp. CCMP2436]
MLYFRSFIFSFLFPFFSLVVCLTVVDPPQARATAVSTGELRNAITEAESGLLAETRGLALELDRWRRSADAIDARAIALSDGHGGVRAQLEQMGGRYAALEGAVAQLAARAALRSEPQQQSRLRTISN